VNKLSIFSATIICLLFADPTFAQPFDEASAVANYLKLHAASCSAKGANCDELTWSIWGHLDHILIVVSLLIFFFSGWSSRWAAVAERGAEHRAVKALVFALPLSLMPWIVVQIGKIGAPLDCPIKSRFENGVISCAGESGSNFIVDAAALWLGAAFALFILQWLFTRLDKRSWLAVAALWCCYLGYAMNGSDVFRGPGSQIEKGAAYDRIAKMAAAENYPIEKIRLGVPKGSLQYSQAQVVGIFRPHIILGEGYRNLNQPMRHWTIYGHPGEGASDAIFVAVIGHELAHIRQNHMLKLPAVSALLSLLFCWLCYRIWRAIIIRSGGTRYATTPWSLSSFSLLAPLALLTFFAFHYARNPFIYLAESEADRVGLDISREPDGFADFVLWHRKGASIRHGAITQWTSISHPSGEERIRTAMRWKARNINNPELER
jgi:Peptidase family M48